MSITDNDYFKWQHFDYEKIKPVEGVYNFGLSHGIPSIIIFLINCYEERICTDLTRKMVIGAIEFITSKLQNMEQIGSAFAYQWNEEQKTETKSRLAWCYGDLGILYVLTRAAKAFNLDHLQPIIDNISSFECSRKNLIVDNVYDGGFCHGSSGISHIFLRLYQLTKNRNFLKASQYWLEKTLEMGNHAGGFAGYKTFRAETSEWVNDISLIEGVPGIGLAFISSTSSINYKWDEIFILR